MIRTNQILLFFLILSVLLISSSCQPATVKPGKPPAAGPGVPPVTKTPLPDLGKPVHPIKLVFSPSADADVIQAGSRILVDSLSESTGLKFNIILPDSYTATTEAMCASPADTMGFITGLGYALTSQMCAVQVGYSAVRYGYNDFWVEILVPRDGDIDSLDDLNGRKWGYGDPGYTTDYLVPLVMFNEAGVTPGEQIQTGGHKQSLQALYNGEVDFVTTYFSPPTDVDTGSVVWSEETPDIPDHLFEACRLSEDAEEIVCGNLTIHDARVTVRKTAPDVVQRLRVLAISSSIPNDTLSFSRDFPVELRSKIGEALMAITQTESWHQSIGSQDFYNWSGIAAANASDYDIIRNMAASIWPELMPSGN